MKIITSYDDFYRKQIEADTIAMLGEDHQVDICIEEMSELTKALLKLRRRKLENYKVLMNAGEKGVNTYLLDVQEEIADVFIMLEQMAMFYDDGRSIEKIMYEKIQRQESRLLKYRKEKPKEQTTTNLDDISGIWENRYEELPSGEKEAVDEIRKAFREIFNENPMQWVEMAFYLTYKESIKQLNERMKNED